MTHADPIFAEAISTFRDWLERAEQTELQEPTAMSLATASAEGRPSVRIVLLRGFDEDGCVFYTNSLSQKGVELAANPYLK